MKNKNDFSADNFIRKSLIKNIKERKYESNDCNAKEVNNVSMIIPQKDDIYTILRSLPQQNEKGIWLWQPDAKIIYFDNYCSEIFGIDNSKTNNMNIHDWFDRIHPSDQAIARKQLDKIFFERQNFFSYKCRIIGEKQFISVVDSGTVINSSSADKQDYLLGFRVKINYKEKIKLQHYDDNNFLSLKNYNDQALIKKNDLYQILNEISMQINSIRQFANPSSKVNDKINLLYELTDKAKKISAYFAEEINGNNKSTVE